MPAKKNPIKTWEQKFIQVLSKIAGKYGLEIVTSSGYYDRSLNLVRTNVYFQPEDKLVNGQDRWTWDERWECSSYIKTESYR